MSILQYSQTVFNSQFSILQSMIKIKILNSTALYDYTHDLATMLVCESASETGLCQVLHTKRALAVDGMNWVCEGDVNQPNHMLNLVFMMSQPEIPHTIILTTCGI